MDYSAWNTDANNGGFFAGNNQFNQSSASGKKQDGQKRLQNVVPMVIKQLLDCPDDEVKLWGMPVHIVKLVGILRSCDVQSTKAIYQIEDHTGAISAVLWIEQDANSEANLPTVKENSYIKVFGSIRNQDGKKVVMVHRILNVEHANEVTTHLLEVIHARLMSENHFKGEKNGSIRMNNPGTTLSHSMMNFADGMGNATEEGLTPLQQKVFKIVKAVDTQMGVDRSSILQQFPPGQHKDVLNALEFLVSEGHVFTTVDLEHFKSTD